MAVLKKRKDIGALRAVDSSLSALNVNADVPRDTEH
jgi:hypothetical protein